VTPSIAPRMPNQNGTCTSRFPNSFWMTSRGAADSGLRLRARRLTSAGKEARRLNAAGFAFAVVGCGDLMLLLPFKAMLLLKRARGRKSGGPPLFAPSFKVQRNTGHNQSSGSAVAPQVQGPQRARSLKGPS
jgi:hypothetical protein